MNIVERLRGYNITEEYTQVMQEAADEIERLRCEMQDLNVRRGLVIGWKNDEIEALRSDPALHFCHRLAVVLECMTLGNSDALWAEATTLLSEYHEADAKWREAMGEPYVSGFGKD